MRTSRQSFSEFRDLAVLNRLGVEYKGRAFVQTVWRTFEGRQLFSQIVAAMFTGQARPVSGRPRHRGERSDKSWDVVRLLSLSEQSSSRFLINGV
jgi:hypothetical protein